MPKQINRRVYEANIPGDAFADKNVKAIAAFAKKGRSSSTEPLSMQSHEVKQLLCTIEEALVAGTQWIVFESNDEPLWAQIRLNIGSFLQNLFREGVLAGIKPKEAYFVRCDSSTTTRADINRGVVNILVGVALLRPDEFLIIKISQKCT